MCIAHSGSTILSLILDSHSRIKSYGHMRKKLVKPRYLHPQSNIINALNKHLNDTQKGVYPALSKLVKEQVYVDNSQRIDIFKERIKAEGFDYKIIYLLRDPVDLIYSLVKHWEANGLKEISNMNVIKKLIKNIKDFWIRAQLFFKEHDVLHIIVKHEEYANNPWKWLNKICKFIGVDYEPGMLNYWTHDHEFLMGNHNALYYFRKSELFYKTPPHEAKQYSNSPRIFYPEVKSLVPKQVQDYINKELSDYRQVK